MNLYPRGLFEPIFKSKKSVLLLGPRQCGKSTLVRLCEPDLTINLARESEFVDFTGNPQTLEERLAAIRPRSVFIDEVQRVPSILNTVQAILDEGGAAAPKFYLTGSSARKLRRGQANLLPGRVAVYHLAPLSWREMGDRLPPVAQLLRYGSLPGVVAEPENGQKAKVLSDYAGTYLREEVQAEALARDISGFSRFLKNTAAWVGDFMDLSKMASQSQVKRLTAQRYLEILEDTLIAFRVESFAKSEKRRLIQHPKIYFFDVGVWNAVAGGFDPTADRMGKLFEHLIANQIANAAQAMDRPIRISTYRTEHDAEVDFVVEFGNRVFALEVKATRNVGSSDLRGIRSFQEFLGRKKAVPLVAYLGSQARLIDGVSVLPWIEALDLIFG